MSDYYCEQLKAAAASRSRAGADRMAVGLGICVDNDLHEVLRLRAEIARIRESRAALEKENDRLYASLKVVDTCLAEMATRLEEHVRSPGPEANG